jgi:hypothetical protein
MPSATDADAAPTYQAPAAAAYAEDVSEEPDSESFEVGDEAFDVDASES